MNPDKRIRVIVSVPLAVVACGFLVLLLPERARELPTPPPEQRGPAFESPRAAYAGEVHERFQQAAVMLRAGQYLYALEALERVLELSPRLPEAHVNAGFALLGLARADRAADRFRIAIDLRPAQANAYYGLAVAMESLQDLDAALGAMRTYLHLTQESGRFVRRARAAIWEWEQQRDKVTNTTHNIDPQAKVDS